MEIVGAFIMIAGMIMFASWYRPEAAKIRRALRNARHVAIAEAPEGAVVRLQGRVVDGVTLQSPLTGRRCVYYLALVEEWVSNDWRVRVRESRCVPFVIEDGTGRALIVPANARIDVDLDSIEHAGPRHELTPTQRELFNRHGMQSRGWIFKKTLRYREGVFEVGESIAVICQPVREPDLDAVSATAGYRDGPPTRLHVSGSVAHPILLSDARDITQPAT